MDSETISGLLLNFSAVAGAMVMRQSPFEHSRVTRALAPFLMIGGVIAGFVAIFAFIRGYGIGYGLWWWIISGLVFSAICMRLFDGVRSLLGVVSLLIGGGMFIRTIW